jgi:hypothetical protein
VSRAIEIRGDAPIYRAAPQQHALVEDVATVMNESMSPEGAAAPRRACAALDATERVTHQ